VNCYAPFVIMIGLLDLVPIGPFTTFHLSPPLDLIGFILMHNVVLNRAPAREARREPNSDAVWRSGGKLL